MIHPTFYNETLMNVLIIHKTYVYFILLLVKILFKVFEQKNYLCRNLLKLVFIIMRKS